MRGDVQQNGDVFGDISVRQPQYGSKSPITPEEQDWDAAETLVEVAKGQRTVSTAMDTKAISVDTGGDSDADASIEDFWRCRFATCEYYHGPFLLKMERDEHTRKLAKGNIKCDLWSCRFASAAKPENPKFYFENVEQLKNHINKNHHGVSYRLGNIRCDLCCRIFSDDNLSYLEHFYDCVHALEVELTFFPVGTS